MPGGFARRIGGGHRCAVVLLALSLAIQPQPAGAGLQDAQGLDALVPEHGVGPLGVMAEEGGGRKGGAPSKEQTLDLLDKVLIPSELPFWQPPPPIGQILCLNPVCKLNQSALPHTFAECQGDGEHGQLLEAGVRGSRRGHG